jgi:uncharacterized protein YodC (DUF2158 family)
MHMQFKVGDVVKSSTGKMLLIIQEDVKSSFYDVVVLGHYRESQIGQLESFTYAHLALFYEHYNV